MSALLAVWLSCAAATELEQAAEREPSFVIDLYPHAMSGALLVGGAIGGGLAVHVPVSVTAPIGPTTAVHVEAAVTYVDARSARPGWSVSASLGPLFSFGETALSGFFIAPLFTFQISSAMLPLGTQKANGPFDLGREWSRAFLAGVELGYQWTWGSRHIAVMIGGSFGYQYDGETFVSELGLGRSEGRFPPPRHEGFAFGINANLFRIGFAL